MSFIAWLLEIWIGWSRVVKRRGKKYIIRGRDRVELVGAKTRQNVLSKWPGGTGGRDDGVKVNICDIWYMDVVVCDIWYMDVVVCYTRYMDVVVFHVWTYDYIWILSWVVCDIRSSCISYVYGENNNEL